jgi:hypothetical protein
LITDLAESGADDQTIMDIAGHVSKQMLKHYSHIRMQAKRSALEALVKKPEANEDGHAIQRVLSEPPQWCREGENGQRERRKPEDKGEE